MQRGTTRVTTASRFARLTSTSWTHILLALSFMALVGVTLFGLFNSYRNMLEREGESAANLADSMQVYVTAVLTQSLLSVEGIAVDPDDVTNTRCGGTSSL